MFWRHVVASHLGDEEIPGEEAGSTAYQDEHMGLIFEEGMSFSGFERDCVFIGDGTGRFADLSGISGADHPGDGRALVATDFDDDGDADVFLHNIQRERHALFRNDAATGGFVKVRVRGTSGARDAAGAVVRLERGDGSTQAQLIALGSGFISSNAPELIFGLGDRAGGSLSVTWPGGTTEDFGQAAAGARLLLVEGTGSAEAYPAHTFAFPDPLPPGVRIRPGDSLTELAVQDAAGNVHTLDLTSDGETLLNVWATTCASCVAEIPQLQEEDDAAGTRVIGISVDHARLREAAGDLIARRGGSYANWFVDGEQLAVFADPDRLAIPMTIWLDAEGTVLRILQGPIK